MGMRKINLKRLDLKELFETFNRLIDNNPIQNRNNKRGRPPVFKESLIYFALSIKQIYKLSGEI